MNYSVPPSPQFHSAALGKPLDAAALAKLYSMPLRAAQAWLRDDLPNFSVGRRRYTTESWLAAWEAMNLKNPPRPKCFDPLMEPVIKMAGWMVGELVLQGKIAVLAKSKNFPEANGSTEHAEPSVEPLASVNLNSETETVV